MHMVIRAIVYAKDKADALSQADSIFERLCENQHPFDYYQMFDTEGTSVSGKGRWGDLPDAVLASSKEGKELIDDGFKYTKEEFMRSIKAVREAMEKNDDEALFEDKIEIDGMRGMFRYFCHCVGKYDGSGIYLYNNDGEGIRNQSDLDETLSKYKNLYEDRGEENPHKDDEVWVVPADVHF